MTSICDKHPLGCVLYFWHAPDRLLLSVSDLYFWHAPVRLWLSVSVLFCDTHLIGCGCPFQTSIWDMHLLGCGCLFDFFLCDTQLLGCGCPFQTSFCDIHLLGNGCPFQTSICDMHLLGLCNCGRLFQFFCDMHLCVSVVSPLLVTCTCVCLLSVLYLWHAPVCVCCQSFTCYMYLLVWGLFQTSLSITTSRGFPAELGNIPRKYCVLFWHGGRFIVLWIFPWNHWVIIISK